MITFVYLPFYQKRLDNGLAIDFENGNIYYWATFCFRLLHHNFGFGTYAVGGS